DKQRLAPLQPYVGAWRGVGLPKRGSNQGAWSETSDWSWTFDGGRASLTALCTPGKFFERIVVRPGAEADTYLVEGFQAGKDGKPVTFEGRQTDGELVATAQEPQDDSPQRITVRLVAGGDRMLVLYEKRLGEDA